MYGQYSRAGYSGARICILYFEQKFNYCTFELLGAFPLSNVSLMTDEERARFLPAVRTFTSVLQKDYVDPEEMKILMAEAKKLQALLRQNLKGSINNAVTSTFQN